MSKVAARIVAEVLNTKPNAVLGMATGSTPLGLYQELVRLHKVEQLDFARVTTFNLDEYVGLTANHPQSYHYFMHEHFFQHVNIPRQNINIPSGTTSNYPAFCTWYEERITECGGIDLQIDRKSTRLNSSHTVISYAVFCLKKKKTQARAEHPDDTHTQGYHE